MQNPFSNYTKFYIMANINSTSVTQRLDERKKTLLLGNLPQKNIPHLTLLQLEINRHHNSSKFFENNSNLTNFIGNAYTESFKKAHVSLK